MTNLISEQAHKLINLTRQTPSKHSKTKILTITSGKGGVGKSTFTANISHILASKNKKVAVLDADIGLANMQVLFDIKPNTTFFDYIEGRCNFKSIFLKTKYENITLIAGKSGYNYSNHSNAFMFSEIITEIINLDEYDYLVIDTGAGLNEYVREFLKISDNILAITTTDPSAITDVYALIKMVSNEKNKLMLAFNYTNTYTIGETITNSIINLARKNRLNRNFMVQYLGNVSQSLNIPTTARLRKIFVKEFENEKVSYELGEIVNKIISNIQ